MSGKRNVLVCRGHELANALYIDMIAWRTLSESMFGSFVKFDSVKSIARMVLFIRICIHVLAKSLSNL